MPFLKILFSFFTRSDKKFALFLLLLMLLTALIELGGIGSLFPYIKILSDNTLIHRNHLLNNIYQFFHFKVESHFLIAIGILIFSMLVLKSIMAILNNYFQAKLTYRINNRLSKYCLTSYMNMPYVQLIEHHSSVLSKHLLLDISSVSTLMQAVLTLVTDVMVVLALIALMVSVDPLLVGTVVISLGILLLLMNRFLKQAIQRLSIANERCNRFAYKTANEALSSLKDAKIYNVEHYFISRYLKWQDKVAHQMSRFSVLSNLPNNILNVMGFGILLIVLLYLIMTRGSLIAVLPTISLIAVSVQRLLPSAARISTSIANIRRYKPLVFIVRDAIDFFSAPHFSNPVKQMRPSADIVSSEYALELKNVVYRYPNAGENNALDNISLVVRKNSIFGIVGESGAGKSTLVDALLGLLPIDSGHIIFDGQKISQSDYYLLSHWVGYVPQQVSLLDASIKENIAFGIQFEDINETALEKAISVAQLESFIENQPNGLLTQIGEKGVKISGGQRQRIGIARALYRDPDILILDEATNALDPVTEKEFNKALQALMNKKTVIIIAHRLSSVAICQDIIQLKRGRVIASGSFAHLSKYSESFRHIYNLSENIV